MDDSRSLTIYLEELADRALRFHLHLDAVEQDYFRATPGFVENNFPRDKPLFLDSLRSCIATVLQTAGQLAAASSKMQDAIQRQKLMMVARHAFVCINQLHEQGLIHLPRPSEPVELRRFCRIIARHVLRRKSNDLLVYITEATPDQAYAADPVSQLKRDDFSKLVEMTNTALGASMLANPNITGIDSIHVTIARIDARNPVHWPILLHEAGHKLLTDTVANDDPSQKSNKRSSLFDEFKLWLPEGLYEKLEKLDISVEFWLTETWCDLFAAFVMGPAFFFSQFSAFLAEPPTDTKLQRDYPPHGFRLRLIEVLLRHGYDFLMKSDIVAKHMRECLTAVDYIDRTKGLELGTRADLRRVFDALRLFFLEHFFSGSGSEPENIRKKYEQMVRHVSNIEVKELVRMQKYLSDGLPVASKRRGDMPLVEIPSSVQEVLLAAWLDRLTRVRPETLKDLQSSEGLEKMMKEQILPRFIRFDDAVLCSIQLAEWLHVIAPKVPKPLTLIQVVVALGGTRMPRIVVVP